MKSTDTCETLMCLLLKHNCTKFISQTKESLYIFKMLYDQLKKAYEQLNDLKKNNPQLYDLKITKISDPSQIPKPKTFNDNDIPAEIISHINAHSYYALTFSVSFFDYYVVVHFVIEKTDIDIHLNNEPNITHFTSYIDNMLLWLILSKQHMENLNCGKDLTVFVFMSSLKKHIPTHTHTTLGRSHVNTAFTRTCPTTTSEIVIFRKEEWFKVFIHETFHNFGLDFSGMSNTNISAQLRTIFQIKEDVLLFEAYTEFWAKIVNILICSFQLLDDCNDKKHFLKNLQFLMNYERIFCIFQMVKILKFNGVRYSDLYENPIVSKLYKEETNVFAYFVICVILINEYPSFLKWCYYQNGYTKLMQFKNTQENQDAFIQFIRSKYRSEKLFDGIYCSNKILKKFIEQKHKLSKIPKLSKQKKKLLKEYKYILTNTKLSLCEFVF